MSCIKNKQSGPDKVDDKQSVVNTVEKTEISDELKRENWKFTEFFSV